MSEPVVQAEFPASPPSSVAVPVPRRESFLDLAAAAALLLVAVVTVCGLAVAYLGRFSVLSVALLSGIGILIPLILARRSLRLSPGSISRPAFPEIAVLMLAGGVLAFGTARRFHEVAGLRDPGVYVASGIELSRTGDFGWIDPTVSRYTFYGSQRLMEDLHILLDRRPQWLRFAGFYLDETGRVEPQFLHGYEVWIALAYSLGGVQATQVLNSAFAALALVVVFCAVRAVTRSPQAALFTVLFLAVSPVQLWFARSPGNETLIQALLWGFLLLYARALGEENGTQQPALSAGELPGASSALFSRSVWFGGAMALIGTAALVKIAAWLLLPAIAFDAGFQRASGHLRVRSRTLWLLLVLTTLIAVLHAAFFADTYLYGSWKFTAGRRGISWSLFPVLLVAGTAAAFSVGMLAAPVLNAVGRRLGAGRWRTLLAGSAALLFLGVWVWQSGRLRGLAASYDIWSEGTNIAEFALYFGPVLFPLATLGLALLVARRPGPAGTLFLVLLLGSSVFFVQRNLDASHPWAARRWIPFLYPAFCAGAGYLLAVLGSGRPGRPRRIASVAAALVGAVFLVRTAPQLLLTRQYHGAVPALDRLASRLHQDDLVLAHPSGDLLRWAPYLKARFNVDLYKHPFVPDQSADLYPLLHAAGKEGRRILYLNDGPLTMTLAQQCVLTPLHTELVEYTELPDGIRSPAPSAVTSSQTLVLYRMRPEALTRRWWPGAVDDPPPLPPPQALPGELRMDSAAAPCLDHFLDADERTPRVAFRWTNGYGRIYLGDCFQLPPPPDGGPVTLTLRMSSGRPERTEPLPVFIYLDHGIRGREKELKTIPLGAGWSDFPIEIDPRDLHADSFIEIVSSRPPVGEALPAYQVGCLVQSVRMEQGSRQLH